MRMLSIWQTTPSRPCKMSAIHLWKCSGAELTPKGSLLKHNLPNGVMTAFEILLRSLSRICQNPEFGSIFENQDTFHSLPSMCSTAGMGYPSQRMDLLSSV